MTGPPSPKRQRTDDKPAANEEELEKIQKVLESVGKVEEELDAENEKQAQEILAIETKYNAKKRPAYVKRSKLVQDIPHFWKQVLHNHPLVGHFIEENGLKILDYLKNLDVTFIDENGGYKLEFSFDENPYFTPTTLWKQIKISDEGEADVTVSDIEWKTSDEAKELSENTPFFEWLTSTEGEVEVAEVIKEEIWRGPVQFYLNNDSDDEEEGGEEEEEEEEDGEGEDEE